MLQDSQAFSGFSVDNLSNAKTFYKEKLGLKVEEDKMGLHLKTLGNNPVFIYEKEDHEPASFTILNFEVENIDDAIRELTTKGIVFEQYDFGYAKTDDNGVLRGKSANEGPDIAWFKDPAGNTLAILEN